MQIELYHSDQFRVLLERQRAVDSNKTELVVVVVGARSTRDVREAIAVAKEKLAGVPDEVSRVEVRADEVSARRMQLAQAKRLRKKGA